MSTDTSEKGLESLIVTAMTGRPWPEPLAATAGEPPAAYGGTGWLNGRPEDYNREWCVDLAQLVAFLRTTQPKLDDALDLANDLPLRRAFLARLSAEVGKRGVINVLRHGIKHGPHDITLFFATPSAGNSQGRRPAYTEPLFRDPPVALQPRRNDAGAGYGYLSSAACRWRLSS